MTVTIAPVARVTPRTRASKKPCCMLNVRNNASRADPPPWPSSANRYGSIVGACTMTPGAVPASFKEGSSFPQRRGLSGLVEQTDLRADPDQLRPSERDIPGALLGVLEDELVAHMHPRRYLHRAAALVEHGPAQREPLRTVDQNVDQVGHEVLHRAGGPGLDAAGHPQGREFLPDVGTLASESKEFMPGQFAVPYPAEHEDHQRFRRLSRPRKRPGVPRRGRWAPPLSEGG